MDLEAVSGGSMSKKKAPKGALHGPAGGSFSQKKKVVIENVKHLDNEKDISLNKSGSGGNVFSDVDSLSGNDNDASMSGFYGGSPLGSAVNTPKVKRVNTGAVFESPLKSPNFTMNDIKVVLPPHVPISLDRKWVDPKIVKVPVKISVKKSFALDINLSAVEGKSATAKTQIIRKIFSLVNEESIEVAASLAREKRIVVNTDLKKQGMHSDWAVVLKKILMDMPKDMIVATKAVVEFTKSSQTNQLASKWSFLIGKDLVRVARAVGDCDVWALRDCYRALLFTLPMGTTVHNLGTFLDKVGGKTCVINHSLETGNRFCCAVVCFESVDDLNSAFLGGVQLSWARFDLVCYGKCGHLGHLALECDASNVLSLEFPSLSRKPASNTNRLQLARLYAKKNVPISHSAAFGGKSWAQVVSLAFSSSGSSSGFGFGSGVFSLGVSDLGGGLLLLANDNSSLNAQLASLEHSLKLLHDQVSGIVYRLSSMNLVPLAPFSSSLGILDVPAATNFDMILDDTSHDPVVALSLPHVGSDLGLSSSKVLTSKVDSLESKLVALNASIGAILEKLNQLCTSSDFQASSSSQ
ncbi:hypothetical protein G9A89_000847 [Geosiphon pyriformis]|nr:hypothetical protein G9A89_000847 [Geosiphon pyriformis]